MPQVNTNIFEASIVSNTVDALTTVLSIDMRDKKQASVVIKNNGVVSMSVQILSYNLKNGSISTIEVPLSVITAGSTLRYFSSKYIAQLIFQAKSTTPGNPTGFIIEYTTSK